MDRSNPRHGFTLIEVVIVVAIIGIASALIFSSFSGQRSIRNLERAAREVMASLREAQNYALSGRSAAISENNTYFGIQVSPPTSYNLISSNGTVASYTLKSGITFSSGAVTLGFAVPRGDVLQGGGPMASASYVIGLTNGSRSAYICLYRTGRIIDNGTSSSCP